MPRATLTAVALAFACAPFAVQAQVSGTGLYLYGAVANSSAKFDQAQLDNNLRAAGATGVASSLDERYMAVKAMLGYQMVPGLAIEAGYVDFGKFIYNASITNVAGGSVNTDIKASGIVADIVKTYPVNPDLSIFAKLGAVYAKTEIHARSAVGLNPAAVDSRDRSYTPSLGAGFNIILGPKSTVRFGYERFFRVGAKNTTGRVDIDLLSIGMTYSF